MSGVTAGVKPRFVVDGQAPMRQCLHPEACNKDIELPEHYNYFHDLRKDFVECYSSHGELSTLGVQEMLQCILSCLRKKIRHRSPLRYVRCLFRILFFFYENIFCLRFFFVPSSIPNIVFDISATCDQLNNDVYSYAYERFYCDFFIRIFSLSTSDMD